MAEEGAGAGPHPRRSPGRLDRTRDPAILNAALQGVAELGYDRLSVDDIAGRAGVGKAAIYRRWPSKAVVVADAIAHWRRQQGSVEPPNTGSLRGDIETLVAMVPEFDDAGLSMIQVIVGVAAAAMHNPVLAAALDDLVLDPPRHVIRVLLDQALARGEIPAGRDLSLIPDVALGLNMLRVMTGRPVDRVFVRRVLEDVILPLTGAPTP
ncbi:TetR/AcrR family transcriptional regulator [Mycolicibacter heraklionensis]|uniref:TetR/AcrR family transcriptional regulator n=1 Tax=Mycolicibacter heraklionensis TaxID=512402 RepID=A0A9X7WL25_9MYCO|nr:TetR/AcrR family transcriptional regulator [Mycolicibacter heraklionensis]QZA09359.1 TetR/AcrR family transcriptional regulator [Mycolicibacter heraklionensis]